LELGRAVASLPAFAYHYDRLARRSLTEIEGGGETVRLKAYCYALRGALALAWIRECETPPPMDLPSLLAGVSCPDQARQAIAALVRRKAEATEKDMAARISALDDYLSVTLATSAERPASDRGPERDARIDRLFEALITLAG